MIHADLVERERQLETEGRAVDHRVCPRCAWGRWFCPSRPPECSDYPERVHQGDTIVVPKGATVHTYAKRSTFTAGRTYRVKVHHFIGYLPRWTGESGYWTWTEGWECSPSKMNSTNTSP